MRGYESFFKDKRVTIMGLGLLGRGAGDAEFIARYAKEIVVTDKKTEVELAEPLARLSRHPNITFHVDGHDTKDFTNTDMVIKAAGVRLDSPEIAAARAVKVPVYMSTALFAKFAREAGATIVGVTGTRGKSTVSHLMFHTLQKAAPRQSSGRERHVFLGGNVRGVSTLAMLPEIQSGDICVLELDSWQLQGFGDLRISPQVAVFTNLMPDHQNYYPDLPAPQPDIYFVYAIRCDNDAIYIGQTKDVPNRWKEHVAGESDYMRKHKPVKLIHYEEYTTRDEAVKREKWLKTGFGRKWLRRELAAGRTRQAGRETYFADKANIFKYQREGDVLIGGPAVVEQIRKATPYGNKPRIPDVLPVEWQLGIVGEHNRENAALAAAALRSLGLSEEDIRAGLETFEPVEGRLQLVREFNGVKIYNDNNATTPEATIAAINSFPPGKVVLVAGGADKGLELRALASLVGSRCKSVYLLSGTGTEVLKKHLIAPVFDSLEKAVHAAFDASVSGDILLFSPGFASFGMFKNEYDRNDRFLKIVRGIC